MSQQPLSCCSRYLNTSSLSTLPTTVWRFSLVTSWLFCFAISGGFVRGQEVTTDVQAKTQLSKDIQPYPLPDTGKQDNEPEDEEVCRLVLKIEFSSTKTSAVSRLRADIAAGVFDDYAISEIRSRRLKKSPKISVPVGRNRYRVWYGYSAATRNAVLATASAQPPVTKQTKSQISQVAYEEESKHATSGPKGKYPHRESWWTVGKRYPDREAMVKHLSSGQHKGVFAIEWLASLSRDELHALHSDDHEKKVQWSYAVRAAQISQGAALKQD